MHSDCIINDNHDYLLEFLEGLAVPEHSATIQDWDTAGRVYLDYIRVVNTLQDIQQVPSLFNLFHLRNIAYGQTYGCFPRGVSVFASMLPKQRGEKAPKPG